MSSSSGSAGGDSGNGGSSTNGGDTGGGPQACSKDADCPPLAQCKVPFCDHGACSSKPDAMGTSCNDGGTMCDKYGECVECFTAADCPNSATCQAACQSGKCNPATSPTGTPCAGNKVCDGFANCVDCVKDADCNSDVLFCDPSGNCVSHCNDQKTDVDESDTDCGGSCPVCDCDHVCHTNTDCYGQFCKKNNVNDPSGICTCS